MEFDWKFFENLLRKFKFNCFLTRIKRLYVKTYFWSHTIGPPTARTHLKVWSDRRRRAESTWYVCIIRNAYIQWMNSLYSHLSSVLLYRITRQFANMLAVVAWKTLVTNCCYHQCCLVISAISVPRLQQMFIARCVYEFRGKAVGPAIRGFKKQILRIYRVFSYLTDKRWTDALVSFI